MTIRNVEITRPVPEEAKRQCSAPVVLPDRGLTAKETTSLWGRDRSALRECERRRALAAGGQ